MAPPVVVQITVSADLQKVWNYWTAPEHIVNWNFANEDWHCPQAINDLKNGGQFNYRMASKDGQMAFNFEGTHDQVITLEKIYSHLEDGRKFVVEFEHLGDQTKVTESFEPERSNPVEMQKLGWQAILDNFKRYVEAN